MSNLTRQWQSMLLIVSCLFLFVVPLFGQSIIKPTNISKEAKTHFFVNDAFPTIGQSFMATKSGFISAISIAMDKNISTNKNTKNIKFWLGLNPSTGKILSGVPYQTIDLSVHHNDGQLDIVLAEPFWVVKGKIYRMQFGYPKDIGNTTYLFEGSIQDNYPNGAVYFNNGRSRINRDLNFSITVN